MRRTLFITLTLFFALNVFGQDWKEHDNLFASLKRSKQDTNRMNILLKLAEFEIFKPGEYKTDLDSAATFINQAKQLNMTFSSPEVYGYITIEESFLAKDREDRVKSKALLEKAVNILKGTPNKYLLGKATLALTDYYDSNNLSQAPAILKIIQQAADEFKSGGYIEREAYCYRCLAENYPDNEGSFRSLKTALSLYESIHYTKLQGIYDLFATLFVQDGDYRQSIYYDLKALQTAKNEGDSTSQLTEINNHLGMTYYDMKDWEKAIQYYRDALVTAERDADEAATYSVVHNMAITYSSLKKPKEAIKIIEAFNKKHKLPDDNVIHLISFNSLCCNIYMQLGQIDKAQSYCNKLIVLSKDKRVWPEYKSVIYAAVMSFFIASHRYSEMYPYLVKNKEIVDQMHFPDYTKRSYNLWFRYDYGMHHYKSAVDQLVKYQALSDSLLNATKIKQMQVLQIKFDTKTKEDKITLLSQKNALEQANLKEAKLVNSITIGGILFALITAGLFFRQSRTRKKNNLLITQKNLLLESLVTEKEWLLKEVHHRVKNNLHTVICLLESQAAYLENDALKAIESSQHRIYAMSLIHQKLYQSEDIKTIDMEIYLTEFINYLYDSFGRPDNIRINLVVEPLKLDVAKAIPIGLIINEAVTNAFKYAFPNNEDGHISISLVQKGDEAALHIIDTGIGISNDPDDNEPDSLGMELMKGLTRDIKGSIEFKSNNGKGTQIVIVFTNDSLDRISLKKTI